MWNPLNNIIQRKIILHTRPRDERYIYLTWMVDWVVATQILFISTPNLEDIFQMAREKPGDFSLKEWVNFRDSSTRNHLSVVYMNKNDGVRSFCFGVLVSVLIP